jgi:hypothetical protein
LVRQYNGLPLIPITIAGAGGAGAAAEDVIANNNNKKKMMYRLLLHDSFDLYLTLSHSNSVF